MKFITRWWRTYKENQLLRQVAAGNVEAFRKFSLPYEQLIFVFAKSYGLSDALAHSLRSDFQSKLWFSRLTLNQDRNFDILLADSVKEVLRCVIDMRIAGEK